MNIPTVDNQQFSEQTLKGFLLKNVDVTKKDPVIKLLNNYLIQRVDDFWDTVIVPLRRESKFDGNKINWYFEIYKEGLEAHKVSENPFKFVNITKDNVKETVRFLKDKTVIQYLDLGTSFLTSCFSLLSSWYRDQLVLKRLEHIYGNSDPYKWIIRAEEEENGIMREQTGDTPEVSKILNNIGLIISHRV